MTDTGTTVAVSLTQKPVAALRTAWQEVDGEAVVIDLDTRKVLGLNATASLVWTSMDGRRTVEELCGVVAQSFGVPVDAARRDVVAFLDQMVARGLVELG